MTTTDVTKAPCDEAARKQAAWGNAVMGGLLGALAGALAGALIDKMLGNNGGGKGTKVGAVAGAALGAKVGYDRGVASANRQCEVWRAAQALATDQGFATLQIGKEVAGGWVPAKTALNPFTAFCDGTGVAISCYEKNRT